MAKVYLPWVISTNTVANVSERERCGTLVVTASWQQREEGYIDSKLMQAAQWKADDLATQNYFAHTSPTGDTPNEYVRRHGYVLPGWYPEKGNNVESLCIGATAPEKVIQVWLDSPSHRPHLAGENDFWRSQRAIGMGVSKAQDGRTIWVFISAPPQD